MKRVAAQTRVEILLTIRRSETLLVTLGLPAATLALGLTVPAFGKSGAAILPGTLTAAVMATCMVGIGIATAFERGYGVLKRLGGTPLQREELLAAKIIAALILEILQVLLLLAIARAAGVALEVHISRIAGTLILGSFAFASFGFLMAGTFRAEVNLGLLNGIFVVLLFMGDIFVAPSALPGPLEGLARFLPAANLTSLWQWAISGGSLPYSAAVSVLGWGTISALWSRASFDWGPA